MADAGNDNGQKQRGYDQRRIGVAILAALAVFTLAMRAAGTLPPRAGGAATRGAPAPVVAPPPTKLVRQSGSAVGFGVTLDRGAVERGSDGLVRMELAIKANPGEESATARVDSDFVVVLDRSGSMEGERLAQARAAVLALIDQLAEGDRFGLIVYDDAAQVAIPLARAAIADRPRLRAVVSAIESGGGTNMSEGLDRGLGLLEEAHSAGRAGRLILLSDGHANAGDSSPEGLRARGQRAARRELVLSTIGIGEGFNEYLMTAIADAGTGNYHYLAQSSQLAEILERELSSTHTTVATGLSVRIAPASGVEVVDAAGYPLEPSAGAVGFQVGSLFAGQERRVWVTLRVPTGEQGQRPLGALELVYTEAGQRRALSIAEPPAVACVASAKAALASIDKGAWERAVVQEEWGRVQERVARAVSEGKRDEALRVLDGYRKDYEPVNAQVGSTLVRSSLAQSKALAQSVEDSFVGPDQRQKQNVFSKQNQAKGRMERRVGSYWDGE